MSKICKKCKTEIDDKAKICPNCRSKQGGFPKWVILLIVIIIIGIIASSGGESSDGGSSSKRTSKKEEIYNIGDVITTNKYELVVTSVQELDSVGTEYFNKQPSEGGVFVVVDFKYKNITKKPIGMFSFPSIKLLDSENTEYSNDIDASSYYEMQTDPDRKVVSDLNPNISVNDSDVFEISKDSYSSGEWKLKISAGNTVYIKVK